MPKMKTKSSVKKRFRLTGTGKVRANVGYKRHQLSAKTQKMKRKARGTMILSDADAGIGKHFIPSGGWGGPCAGTGQTGLDGPALSRIGERRVGETGGSQFRSGGGEVR